MMILDDDFTLHSDGMTVAAWLESYGFERVAIRQGHDVSYIRDHDDIRETVTLADLDDVPDNWNDRVTVSTDDCASGVSFTDADNVPMWALRDMIDSCDCYELWGLRIANTSQAIAHDAHCRRRTTDI